MTIARNQLTRDFPILYSQILDPLPVMNNLSNKSAACVFLLLLGFLFVGAGLMADDEERGERKPPEKPEKAEPGKRSGRKQSHTITTSLRNRKSEAMRRWQGNPNRKRGRKLPRDLSRMSHAK